METPEGVEIKLPTALWTSVGATSRSHAHNGSQEEYTVSRLEPISNLRFQGQLARPSNLTHVGGRVSACLVVVQNLIAVERGLNTFILEKQVPFKACLSCVASAPSWLLRFVRLSLQGVCGLRGRCRYFFMYCIQKIGGVCGFLSGKHDVRGDLGQFLSVD